MPEEATHGDEDALQLGGCRLRRWRKDDLESLVEHANDERVSRYMGPLPYPYTHADGAPFLDAQASAAEPSCVWAIEVDGKAVGGIGVAPGARIRRRAGELGYWLGHAYWGRGMATTSGMS
jgi:RimJ/RimL family protein N-acetyltransferase